MKLALRCLIAIFLACAATAVNAQKKNKLIPAVKPAPSAMVKCEVNALTQPEITELLALHNKARAEQKLPPLAWDCSLANLAQQWASRGVFAHRSDTSYGENIFVASSSTEAISTVVRTWLNEKANWTNKTGVCSPGKVCTHYTQVMWNTTSQIGCGINRSSPGQWKTLVVCNYNPAGNIGGPAY
jgi:pathogenesis-related protein 1